MMILSNDAGLDPITKIVLVIVNWGYPFGFIAFLGLVLVTVCVFISELRSIWRHK